MSNTPPIKGYHPLEPEMVELANQNKLIEELALRQLDRHVRNHDSKEIDQRWVALARTQLQQGFMALNRAVFQPTRIEGELSLGEIYPDLFDTSGNIAIKDTNGIVRVHVEQKK